MKKINGIERQPFQGRPCITLVAIFKEEKYAISSFCVVGVFAVMFNGFLSTEARLLRFSGNSWQSDCLQLCRRPLYSFISRRDCPAKSPAMKGMKLLPNSRRTENSSLLPRSMNGNTEVYLMPAEGGIPKRLTYTATLDRDDVSDRMGPNNIVMGWKGNNQVVYRSRNKQWNDFKGDLLLVSVDGGLSDKLPLPRGGFCSYSPDMKKLAYNRVFREFRTWKFVIAAGKPMMSGFMISKPRRRSTLPTIRRRIYSRCGRETASIHFGS